MNRRWDVLGFGAVTIDDLFYVDHYPDPDTKVPIRASQRQGGGLAGTALVAAARLGARTAYCGVLGCDELSRLAIEEFEREGIDCSPIVTNKAARPHYAVVIVDRSTRQRSILHSNMGVVKLSEAQITPELIAGCRVLFLDYTVIAPGLKAVELAHRHQIPVVADLEPNDDPQLTDFVGKVDHLIIGAEMAQQLTGESDPAAAVRALSKPDRACCVVTAGDAGCWYAERGGEIVHVPAIAVEVVDTTGCGDVFHGAYAACLAQGESIDVAIRVATVAAGLKATQPGGRAGIPDRATVNRYLKER